MIEIKNIQKSYGKHRVLNNLNMEIKKGELIGLIGPNGAGKSTLISIISTILRPDSGQIFYDGRDIYKENLLKEYRRKIAIVPQEIALYDNMSGLENLKFFGSAYGLKGKQLTQKIEEIADIITIKERLKDKVSTYSGGMARRLNIGVALLNSPEVLIMDEPTVGIDPQSRNYILESVKSFNASGMSVLYTTHYMEEVENLCKKVYIMDRGNIILEGDIQEILEEHMREQRASASASDSISASSSALTSDSSALNASSNIKQNLEGVFLKLTGTSLRD